jgi:hypothetical protein
MSETTVPARLGSLKDVIGPGIVLFLTRPAAPPSIIWVNSLPISRGMRI